MLGKVIFTLDARLDLTADELHLVRKYRIGGHVVYESANREKYSQAALAHLERTKDTPRLTAPAEEQMLGAAKTFYRLARGAISATAASLSLRITIDGLISGIHIECKSLPELIEAENAIVQAAQNLKSYLQTSTTFDGRDEILEF